ncbi:serine protease [Saccharothrix sp. NPDC042600]|uniref:S1 family peptidase n=1 Tax=Saccharothrix TaxID=2071 RepID=UPI0033C84B75|nr:serine protease [Saccharothrix mutabilis subsp. capreolus]
MAKRVSVAVAVLTLLVTVAPAHAVTADFTGTVASSTCSGAVVRTPTAQPSDPALVLTNGHCVQMMPDGDVLVDRPSSRSFSLIDREGTGSLRTVRANRLLYATMTRTDAALYRLSLTYSDVEAAGSRALELAAERPAAGIAIDVVSGYWKKVYSCRLDGFVHQLREDKWTWHDSVRYTRECETAAGSSGSPVLDQAGRVVAVNNTMNESGERCTFNNPCEVDASGAVTVRHRTGYAQQTHLLVACLKPGSVLDLNAPDCSLPRP